TPLGGVDKHMHEPGVRLARSDAPVLAPYACITFPALESPTACKQVTVLGLLSVMSAQEAKTMPLCVACSEKGDAWEREGSRFEKSGSARTPHYTTRVSKWRGG